MAELNACYESVKNGEVIEDELKVDCMIGEYAGHLYGWSDFSKVVAWNESIKRYVWKSTGIVFNPVGIEVFPLHSERIMSNKDALTVNIFYN